MMRLRFWIRLRRLSFGLCNEKIKISYQSLIFHYIGQWIGVGQKPKPEPHHFFISELHQHDGAPVLAPTDTYPLAYTVKNQKFDINVQYCLYISQRKGVGVRMELHHVGEAPT
jgi:hypothetical protein